MMSEHLVGDRESCMAAVSERARARAACDDQAFPLLRSS